MHWIFEKKDRIKSMKRNVGFYRVLGGALLVVMSLTGFSQLVHAEEVFRSDEGAKPYSHLDFQNNPNDFQFAVIGDRTGGHRPGVFSAGMDILNLLQPEFVISVGDLIEGYVDGEDDNESVLRSQWAEMDEKIGALDMPMFFVQGNHDVNFDPSEMMWFDRVGARRGYGHFVYKNVLFLMISTEDKPKQDVDPELRAKYEAIKAGELRDPEEIQRVIVELEHWAGQINISDAQVEYFTKVLEANPQVLWTIGFMHSPPWVQADPGNFTKVESLLAGRPYTMFAGHTHTYNYTRRNGRDYITMGMTGAGVQPAESLGNMDHVAWVTMTEEGPIISQILLNGVLDKKGAVPALQDFLLYRPRNTAETEQISDGANGGAEPGH
jgi:hypothetical protein